MTLYRLTLPPSRLAATIGMRGIVATARATLTTVERWAAYDIALDRNHGIN